MPMQNIVFHLSCALNAPSEQHTQHAVFVNLISACLFLHTGVRKGSYFDVHTGAPSSFFSHREEEKLVICTDCREMSFFF